MGSCSDLGKLTSWYFCAAFQVCLVVYEKYTQRHDSNRFGQRMLSWCRSAGWAYIKIVRFFRAGHFRISWLVTKTEQCAL